MLYHPLESFRISNEIESELATLDWRTLRVASAYTMQDWIRQAMQRGMVWPTLATYGWRLQHIGSLISCDIPTWIEHRIRSDMQHRYGAKLTAAASIRLQIVHGGSTIPIHTDLNRETSIVYPILHRSPSVTAFYRCDQELARGMMPPNQCDYIDSVCIDACPAMLDVSMPHAVLYQYGAFTKQRPRVSLSFKFPTLDISTIASMIK